MRQSKVAIVLCFLMTACLQAQEFPIDLVWQVEIEGSATCLGSIWEDGNGTNALIGTQTSLVYVENGEATWQSGELGAIYAAGYYLSGGEVNFAATTISDGIATLHVFEGDDWDETRNAEFGSSWGGGVWGETGWNNVAKWIIQRPSPDMDSSSLVICCSAYFEDREISGYSDHSSGYIHEIDISSLESIREWSIHQPVSYSVVDLNHDDIGDLLFFGKSWGYSVGGDGLGRSSSFCGVSILASDSALNQRILLAQGWGYDGDPNAQAVSIFGAAPFAIEGEVEIVISMNDTLGRGTAFYSTPDFVRQDRRNVAIDSHLQVIPSENDRQYLLSLSPEGLLTAYCLPECRSVNSVQLFEERMNGMEYVYSRNGEFAGLITLDGNHLRYYQIGSLSSKSWDDPPIVKQFSLSAFPNPFNSSTTISYSLPRPGRYAIDVIDIQGRLVTRLSDGWKEAGSYWEVLKGGGLASGQYLIQMISADAVISTQITIIK